MGPPIESRSVLTGRGRRYIFFLLPYRFFLPDGMPHEAAHPETYGKKGMQTMKPNVKIYTLSTCSHCRNAKKFLTEQGVHYDFTELDMLEGSERAAVLEEVKKLNPRCTFPTIAVGDQVIVGFNETELRKALNL
jgi:glutaredoxin-like protein NrdH